MTIVESCVGRQRYRAVYHASASARSTTRAICGADRTSSMGRAIVPGMAARQKATDDRDVISQLADKGEDTLRQLVERPRRMVDGAIHGLEERLHDVATRLRAIDPLERRVAAIEKRLDALEKPAKATARGPSIRGKPSTAATQRKAVAIEPGQSDDDLGRAGDTVVGHHERDEAPARGEPR